MKFVCVCVCVNGGKWDYSLRMLFDVFDEFIIDLNGFVFSKFDLR